MTDVSSSVPTDDRLVLQSVGSRTSLRNEAIRTLQAAIIAGELRPNVVYSAPALAAQLGMSATPVREAFLDLVKEGLVETVRNKGFRVVELAADELDELTEVRLLLEVPSARALARRGLSPAEYRQLKQLAGQIERAAVHNDMVAHTKADLEFHTALLGLLGNQTLVAIVGSLRIRSRLYGLSALADTGQLLPVLAGACRTARPDPAAGRRWRRPPDAPAHRSRPRLVGDRQCRRLSRCGARCRSRRLDGRTVGAVGLGCMPMSWFYDRGAANGTEAAAVVSAAIEAGVTLLDTADVYGPFANEALLGQALAGRRDEAFLATKVGLLVDGAGNYHRNGSRAHIVASCDASLQRLRTDRIDLYQLHRVDPAVPVEESMQALAELVQAGKVRAIGLSEVSVAELDRAAAIAPIASVQSEFSLWTRDPVRNGVLRWCETHGAALLAYAPLGRGYLTGRIRSVADLPADDWRRQNPRFQPAALRANERLLAKSWRSLTAAVRRRRRWRCAGCSASARA